MFAKLIKKKEFSVFLIILIISFFLTIINPVFFTLGYIKRKCRSRNTGTRYAAYPDYGRNRLVSICKYRTDHSDYR